MPSRDELNLLDVSGVGGLTPGVNYWSSSQDNANRAWNQRVGLDGGANRQLYDFKYLTSRVRAVRAF